MLKKIIALCFVTLAILCLPACNTKPDLPVVDEPNTIDLQETQTPEASTGTEVITEPSQSVQSTVGTNTETTESSGSTQPTAGNNTETTVPSESTQPVESTEPAETTEPAESTEPVPAEVTFEEYLAMTSDEQLAYAYSFADMQDFVNWFNAAKAEYSPEDVIEVTGPVDLGDL